MKAQAVLLLFASASFSFVGHSSAAAQTVTNRSPFMPEGSPGVVAPTENPPLELRGIVSTKSGYLFGIYDPAKRQSYWVRQNEAGAEFSVRSFDAANETVTIDYQGRSLNVGMKAAKVESMGPLPNPGTISARPPAPPPVPVASGAPVTPTAQQEKQRLEDVAAEVRRRRQLRQAASQNGPQPQVMPQPPSNVPAGGTTVIGSPPPGTAPTSR